MTLDNVLNNERDTSNMTEEYTEFKQKSHAENDLETVSLIIPLKSKIEMFKLGVRVNL